MGAFINEAGGMHRAGGGARPAVRMAWTVLQTLQLAHDSGMYRYAATAVPADAGRDTDRLYRLWEQCGLLAARALRERDRACRIILIDDTTQYAIQGLHLHFADFILRPVEFRHVTRSMRLALERF